MAEALHVANGHCTTRLIEAAGLPGRTSIWADALHDGPVPDVSDEELVRIRAAFISDGLDVSAEEVEADLKHWRDVVDADDGYDELVLWFEHDLFDQLNLIQLLTRIGRDRPIRRPVSLISIDRYPGHPHFKGLGELTPADISALYDTRQPVTPQQFRLAADAWDAFRSGQRADLDALLADNTSALPFLAPALRRHLDEAGSEPGGLHPNAESPRVGDPGLHPNAQSPCVGDPGLHPNAQSPRVGDPGLTRSERRLMEQLAAGPLDIHTAFAGMHVGETAYYITDSSFWQMVKGLAARSPALIEVNVTATPADRPALPSGTLSLRQ